MKKVVYSIKKVRNPDEKLSGFGFINDEGTLLCKCVSKTGNEANSARYFTPLSLSFPDEISGTTMPIVRKPIRATSARYQLETNPTNRNTAADTSTAMQMGEMVCA